MNLPAYQAMQDVGDHATLEFSVQPRRGVDPSGHTATNYRYTNRFPTGITERPVRRIIAELEAAGYIRRMREGRTNRYEVNPISPLHGPVLRDLVVGDLIDILQARFPQGTRNLRGG